MIEYEPNHESVENLKIVIQKKHLRDTTDRELTLFCDDQNPETDQNYDNCVLLFWTFFKSDSSELFYVRMESETEFVIVAP